MAQLGKIHHYLCVLRPDHAGQCYLSRNQCVARTVRWVRCENEATHGNMCDIHYLRPAA